MKVLVIYCKYFAYRTALGTISDAEENNISGSAGNCIAAFIQIEKEDEERDVLSREKKLVNHIKWTARKNNTTNIVLHSFAHLSDSRAGISFTRAVFDEAEKRLLKAGFSVRQTPFGCFLDLDISAPGYSLARIWANL